MALKGFWELRTGDQILIKDAPIALITQEILRVLGKDVTLGAAIAIL